MDEQWIVEAERPLGRRLPGPYRSRLAADNGGEVEAFGDWWLLNPIFDQSDRKRIKRTCNHIIAETRSAQEWAGFPAGALALGSNSSGDQIVLLPDDSASDAYEPNVYFWNHETRVTESIATVTEFFS